MVGEIRRRRKTAKGSKQKEPSSDNKQTDTTSRGNPSPTTTATTPHDDEPSWKATIKEHWTFPLFCITAIILIPYYLYLSYYFLLLQHPDVVARASFGIWKPRPRVKLKDPRQVLIVGTMSSGTSQTAHDLREKLKLEIGHETADTSWNFVRDGTVSWFHGIRFLDFSAAGEDAAAANKRHSFLALCTNFTESMGFHPSMYRESNCSVREKWSNCWMIECLRVLHEEWGCAVEPSRTCVTPFATVLYQTRHPLRTIESLVTKFCRGGLNGTLHDAFVKFGLALFPQRDFQGMSCIDAAGYYVLEYSRAMLSASVAGAISNRYKVEEASPCDIAAMAGFDGSDAIHPPQRQRIQSICARPNRNAAKEPMASTAYSVNKGQLKLEWDDLLGGKHGSGRKDGDRGLRDSLQRLGLGLGYAE